MIPSKMFGQPLEIIAVVKNRIAFNRECLQQVLVKCGARPLVIYSVAGEYRKGKSFLLNLFLLFNHYKQNNEDWMEKASGEIGGFKAKGGSDRVTSGIWLWSEPILAHDKSGQDVAILLMDTQGTFDRKTTSAVNSFIFGFSIAFSSVTMYNVKEDVTEQDLDNLATFAQSVRHLTGSLQSLKFIVRDWLDDAKYFYGAAGGMRMIADMFDLDENFNAKKDDEKVLNTSISKLDESDDSMDDQLIETRKVVAEVFESISGFLFPPPGDKISKAQSKPVKVKYMDQEFKRSVDQLCQELFVDKITIRESDGSPWTAETFGKKFDKMADAYATGKMVDPGTFREAVGKKIALAANQFAFHSYMEWIEKEVFAEQENTKQVFVSEDFLKNQDKIYRVKAVEAFREKVVPFGKFEKVEGLLLLNINKWLEQKEAANHESIKRKMVEEEKRRIDAENRELELKNRKLVLQAELQLTLRARNEAQEAEIAAREAEAAAREIQEALDLEAEQERVFQEEFDFIQSQNLARIEVIERKKRWWERVVDFLSSTAGKVTAGGITTIGGILLICLLL